MRSALTALAFLALLLLLALRYYPTGGAPEASASGAVLTPLCGRDVLRCASGLNPQPWFVVYGDSVSRGLFFDIAELIEASPGGRAGCAALGSGQPHPGHSANYSDNCVLFESRPPTLRSKCAAFEFVAALPSRRRRRLHRVSALRSLAFVQPNATAGPYRPLGPPPRKRGEVMRLGFRLKAFAWEAGFDEPWLHALADEAAALPDAIVLSFGLWDMQYPQQAGSSSGASVAERAAAFAAALQTFLSRLGDAIDAALARLSARRERKRPRLLWLSVGAIASRALPAWKVKLLHSNLSRAFNDAAAPLLRRAGVSVLDMYTESSAHPEASPDGVHYPGAVSRSHAQRLLRQLLPGCRRAEGSRES
mmetsp:Transcript_7423/g.23690  ORF Transcript_7423/g.23690 Transcript_7423/m.23690 type:complete len:364 (+) Transcript_7423:36-1127(+)